MVVRGLMLLRGLVLLRGLMLPRSLKVVRGLMLLRGSVVCGCYVQCLFVLRGASPPVPTPPSRTTTNGTTMVGSSPPGRVRCETAPYAIMVRPKCACLKGETIADLGLALSELAYLSQQTAPV